MNTLGGKVETLKADGPSAIAKGQPHDFGGLRVIVYSGPHYGRVHRIVGYCGTMAEVFHSGSGDRLFVPLCDLEVMAAPANSPAPIANCQPKEAHE